MRRLVSVGVLVAALFAADIAAAEPPAEVYSDYAEDGVLSCGHSRAAMTAVLNDASIHQYGDPLTLVGLKLAVRKQLAGGCRRKERAALPIGSAARGGGPPPPAASEKPVGAKKSSRGSNSARPKTSSSSGEPRAEPLADDTPSSGQDGRMVLLGVVLLLLTLGSGGWAARRAFGD